MKPYSLTRRLLTAVLLVELASAIALIVLAGGYESLSHFRAFDVMVEGRADSVLGAVEDAGDTVDNIALDRGDLHLPLHDIFLVRDEGGRMLGHSENWPGADSLEPGSLGTGWRVFDRLNNMAGGPGDPQRQFRSLEVNGRRYRALRETGFRTVDPEENGGVKRKVDVIYGSPTEPVWESVGRAIFFYALVSLVLLLASGLLMLAVLRRGLRPLNDLAEQATQVSVRSWAFAPGEHARAVRELAPLVLALETVLAGLEGAFEQQTQFVSDAAHELKTSVAVIKSSVQVLAMRPRTAPQYSAGLERVQIDCTRMEELVASMLTLAGLEVRAEPDRASETDLAGMLREVAEHLRTIAEMGRLRIVLELPRHLAVAGEYEAMRLLCTNLMLNAVQHSAAGEEVRVSLHVNVEGTAEMCVMDHGTGIPAEVLPHIFDRFYRGDPSRSRRTGGTGLGLAIARAVVQRCAGTIDVQSVVGQGTTVEVRLPMFLSGTLPSSGEAKKLMVATSPAFSED
jgi:signal transduction histidine kinase